MSEMERQLTAKIVFEQKTTMQWDEVNEVIPSGLLIIYADEGKNRKIKIGNGQNIPKDLPFLNSELSDDAAKLLETEVERSTTKDEAHDMAITNLNAEMLRA